jgi:hypothetical protein
MAQNLNIDDDTRARARKFVEENNKGVDSEGYDSQEYRSDPYSAMTKKQRDARVGYPDDFPPAVVDDKTKGIAKDKPRVVSKKELEASGLSLRDFLNKERGLTRRSMSVADAKKQLNLGERPSAKSVADAKNQLGINDSLAGMKKGGSVKGWGIARGARKAKMR